MGERIQARGDRRRRQQRRDRPQEAHRRRSHTRPPFRARALAGAFARERAAPFSAPHDRMRHRCSAAPQLCRRRRRWVGLCGAGFRGARPSTRAGHGGSLALLWSLASSVLLAARRLAPRERAWAVCRRGPARRLSRRQRQTYYGTPGACPADGPPEDAVGRPHRVCQRQRWRAARDRPPCRAARRRARRGWRRRPRSRAPECPSSRASGRAHHVSPLPGRRHQRVARRDGCASRRRGSA